MKILKNYMSFSDDRGNINGIIQQGQWQEMNCITTKANVTRGDHYHAKAEELIFIVQGSIKLYLRNVKKNSPLETFTFTAGEAFILEPYENHIIETLEDCTWINMLSCAMNDENGKDILQIS